MPMADSLNLLLLAKRDRGECARRALAPVAAQTVIGPNASVSQLFRFFGSFIIRNLQKCCKKPHLQRGRAGALHLFRSRSTD
jgi:hypothetical protein